MYSIETTSPIPINTTINALLQLTLKNSLIIIILNVKETSKKKYFEIFVMPSNTDYGAQS